MSKRLVVAAAPWKEYDGIATVLSEDERPVECFFSSADGNSILGNIYVGKIETVQKNIGAVFVRIGENLRGYLPFAECKGAIWKTGGQTTIPRVGDELLVQVSREAVKMKQPGLTTNLNLNGRYFVLSSGRKTVNFSRKLKGDQVRRIKSILPELSNEFGLIVRTSAQEAGEEELALEFSMLKEKMEHILHYGTSRTIYTCLYQTSGPWMRQVKQYFSEGLSVVTDCYGVYDELMQYRKENQLEEQLSIFLYEDKMLPLYKLNSISTLMDKMQHKQVWLKSGGFIVIQETEACVVIDVNTGKYDGKKNKEDTIMMINREAVAEIAVQIRLRQLSGIILVDFINMKDPKKQEELMDELQWMVSRDPVKTRVVDLTALQIVEMTRQKEMKSFREQLEAVEQEHE
ncbi:MAG: ribonuclease E/G [Lachnospiraceae bacterium]|nr:ribonuclease E/G [Lachnospiraceae bacterium]